MRAIGIILAGGNNNRMRELSDKRAIAAMPVAEVIEASILPEQHGKFPCSESCSSDAVQCKIVK